MEPRGGPEMGTELADQTDQDIADGNHTDRFQRQVLQHDSRRFTQLVFGTAQVHRQPTLIWLRLYTHNIDLCCCVFNVYTYAKVPFLFRKPTSANWMSKTKVLNIRIDPDLKKKAKKLAEADGRSLSNWVTKLISTTVKEADKAARKEGS